ncbi:MAG: type VI secretion system tip protein TssI/VgrG [Minicystis sp.]
MSKERAIDILVELGIKQPFEVVACTIEEGISETTVARVEVTSMDDLNLESVLTGPAEIALLLDGIVERRWSFKVGGARFLAAKGNSLRFEVELFSTEWIMQLTKDTRKYQNQGAREIVTAVLGRSGVPHEWRITRTPNQRDYCVQYRETNYDFVRRMLEFEGIFYTFDEDGKMILADRSSAAPPIPGLSYFELLEGEGALTDGVEGVHEIKRGARVRPGKYTVNDFDWKKPHTRIHQTKAADRDAHLEIYEYPTGYREPNDGAVLAQMRLEARRVESRYFTGKSSVPRFAPAHGFTFGAAAGAAFAGEYLLTKVVHRYRNPSYPATERERGDHIYENEFHAIPRDVPFRPAVLTPRPNVDGYHTAMVRGPIGEEIHTDKYGRFKAQFHWDREAKGTDEDSRWLRVVQESASSMFLARIGWEMNIGYIDGDPDRPMGLARNINRVMPPAYAQPAKKTMMTIKTPTSPANGGFNEIRLDDTAGAMEFYVRAERDLLNVVKNDRTEKVGVNETRLVGVTLQETVERDQSTSIGANSKTETGGMRELSVKRHRKDKVGATEKIDVGEGMTVKVKGNETEKVGSVRLTIAGGVSMPDLKGRAEAIAKGMVPDPKAAAKKVGQAALDGMKSGGVQGALSGAEQSLKSMIPKPPDPKAIASQMTGGLSDGVTMDKLIDNFCQGSINRSGKKQMTRLVGGAQISAALGNISTSANWGFTEVVGGAKMTLAAEGTIQQSVSGPMATTVGGMVMRSSGSDMSYSAENSFITVGATADLTSDEKLKVESDGTIELVAAEEMKFAVGGVSITLTPGQVRFTGDLTFKAKSKIAITGKPDNVTK